MTSGAGNDAARKRQSSVRIAVQRQLADLLYKSFVALLLFGFFMPLALLLRLVRRDALRLRLDPHAESYWIDRRPPGPQPGSMSNLY